MLGKSSFLDLEPSTMIHADSVSFLTSADDRIQKYSSMFGFPGQIHRLIPEAYNPEGSKFLLSV